MDKKLAKMRRDALRKKDEWRKEQAKLSFEEKIKKIIKLQKIEMNFKNPQRERKFRVWDI